MSSPVDWNATSAAAGDNQQMLDGDGDDPWSTGVYFGLWLGLSFIFACSPFVFDHRKRNRCIARLLGRPVEEDDEDLGTRMYRERRERRRRNAAIRSKAALIKRELIVAQLQNFTMELGENDFSSTTDQPSDDARIKSFEESESFDGGRPDIDTDDNVYVDVDLESGPNENADAQVSPTLLHLPPPGTSVKEFGITNKLTTETTDTTDEGEEQQQCCEENTAPAPQHHFRAVPNSCAICLDSFEIADRVTWSSNPSCQHAFHEECAVSWFVARARRKAQRSISDDDEDDDESYLSCPCCRGSFVDVRHVHVDTEVDPPADSSPASPPGEGPTEQMSPTEEGGTADDTGADDDGVDDVAIERGRDDPSNAGPATVVPPSTEDARGAEGPTTTERDPRVLADEGGDAAGNMDGTDEHIGTVEIEVQEVADDDDDDDTPQQLQGYNCDAEEIQQGGGGEVTAMVRGPDHGTAIPNAELLDEEAPAELNRCSVGAAE